MIFWASGTLTGVHSKLPQRARVSASSGILGASAISVHPPAILIGRNRDGLADAFDDDRRLARAELALKIERVTRGRFQLEAELKQMRHGVFLGRRERELAGAGGGEQQHRGAHRSHSPKTISIAPRIAVTS